MLKLFTTLMIKKIISNSVLFFIFGFLAFWSFGVFIPSVFAQNCSDATSCKKLIEEYENKLSGIRSQKRTLSSEIQIFDTQIYLTTTKIKETELKIKQTEEEIESLGDKIEGLNTSLNYLGEIFIKKIVEGYKRKEVSILNLVLDSNNAMTLSNQLKYIQIAQDNDRRVAFQVQTAKNNFEEQKTLREKKKIELADLKITLDNQKANLDNQKAAKQKLLVDTNNDENTYQALLSKAMQQIAAFSSFVKSSGANSVVGANGLGTGSDGSYFSQRDERWASKPIGNSSTSVLDAGCLLSSISMVLKKNGVDINPAIIAGNSNYFSLNTAYMRYRNQFNPWQNGLNNSQISTSQVDEELKQGRYVIAGINYGGCKYMSDHFVVLIKKDGDDYIMHDPLHGPDLKFSSHYSTVCYAEVFK